MAQSKSSWANGKGSHGASNGSSNSLLRILVVMPVALALFALVLQIRESDLGPSTIADEGLINEKDFIRQVDKVPKLEHELRKHNWRKVHVGGRKPADEGFKRVDWAQGIVDKEHDLKISFIVTTSEPPELIIRWMMYHKAIGVSYFYIFTEGLAGTPESRARLQQEPGVKIVNRDEELTEKQSHSRAWKETWLAAFFNKPCNHELFVKQSLNMEMGIEMARSDNADWILHVDTDELIYPGGSYTYSLIEVLQSVPSHVDLLIFPNYESLAESDDVADPFTEVTLFKKSYAHVDSEDYYKAYGTVARGNPNYYTTYGNGKSAARVIPGLRSNGAHRWHNYQSSPTEWSSEEAAVLHYTYNKFSDLKSRRDRCDCAPTKEDAEKCFILPFDRLAFLEASLKNDAELMEFFRDRLVWDDEDVVINLVHKGLFGRLYEPQLLVRGITQALKKRRGDQVANSTM